MQTHGRTASDAIDADCFAGSAARFPAGDLSRTSSLFPWRKDADCSSRLALQPGHISALNDKLHDTLMNATLTEDLIRSLSTPQSFQRGREYYRAGAISETYRQGDTLFGECEGSSAPYYQLRVELDKNGVRSTSCTCEYDRGGICKHLVAFLLTYLHDPDRFTEQASVPDLLAGLDRDTLVSILVRLADKDPSLYDWIESQAHLTQTQAASHGTVKRKKKSYTQVSAQNYKRQIKNILHGMDGYSSSERYWGMQDMVKELGGITDTARQFLESGDAEGALIILTTLLEEVAAEYEFFDDSDGDLGGFLDELTLPTAEAILSRKN
jgi:uncharacterized Zn finger protein